MLTVLDQSRNLLSKTHHHSARFRFKLQNSNNFLKSPEQSIEPGKIRNKALRPIHGRNSCFLLFTKMSKTLEITEIPKLRKSHLLSSYRSISEISRSLEESNFSVSCLGQFRFAPICVTYFQELVREVSNKRTACFTTTMLLIPN